MQSFLNLKSNKDLQKEDCRFQEYHCQELAVIKILK